MLVYCNNFALNPANGLTSVAECVARWMGQRSKSYVKPEELLSGCEKRLRDGTNVFSASTSSGADISYPFLASMVMSHADTEVSGRQWITEIGLRQGALSEPVQCSILLQTNEISARVSTPIQPTRPRVVEALVQSCSPVSTTPGLVSKKLDESNASAFSLALEHPTREVPWIVVSPTREGQYVVAPARLRSLLVGLAEIIEIPPEADTFAIQSAIGNKHAAWLGAINVIFPSRHARSSGWFETQRFLAERLTLIAEDGGDPATEILACVTHRTNLPCLWRHTSPSTVSVAKLRQQLSAGIQKAQTSEETSEYAALLEVADKEIREKEEVIRSLHTDIEDRDDEVVRLTAENDALKHSLSGKHSSSSSTAAVEAMADLRDAALSMLDDDLSLSQSLLMLDTLCGDRVVVLDSAYKSADASAEFKYPKQAFRLMRTLVTGYYDALVAGQPDAEARKAFGKNDYSAKEAESMSEGGRRRRTFNYQGQPLFMEAHLKIGTKDSVSETLRVHFYWLASEKRLIIGHCGAHINF
ncbi:MAG: hypothetical protein NT015_01560 [Alphaproteobacteria bacterium]|nr:hypothetical protein [Alphaproteobacteria bacterium]